MQINLHFPGAKRSISLHVTKGNKKKKTNSNPPKPEKELLKYFKKSLKQQPSQSEQTCKAAAQQAAQRVPPHRGFCATTWQTTGTQAASYLTMVSLWTPFTSEK